MLWMVSEACMKGGWGRSAAQPPAGSIGNAHATGVTKMNSMLFPVACCIGYGTLLGAALRFDLSHP